MKNINAKVCMLIGLLGSSPLFSCTNTRQPMHNFRYEKGLTQGDCKRWYNRNPKKAICLGIGVGAATVLAAGLGTYYYWQSEPPMPMPWNNSTNSTTLSPYPSPTPEPFNPTWPNSNSSIASTLAYSAYAPSSTTAPNQNRSNASVDEGSTNTPDCLPNNDDIFLKAYSLNRKAVLSAIDECPDLLYMGNSEGCNILMVTADIQDKELVESLLEYRAINVNQQDFDGNAAIHYAVKQRDKCNLEILELLIKDRNVILDARNNDGKRAIDFAEENNHTECAMRLRKAMKDKGLPI